MYSACHTHATYLRKQFCKTNTEVLTHQWPFVYFQELLNMWKYWQGWKAPGVAWEHWKTWNLIIICACLFWSCLIFMSYETHMFRSRHREEFLCKQIIVINCSHNTTVNEQLPRAVQTHRHPARIPVLSAMFFVETSEDQQTQTVCISRMVPHLVLDCRLGKLEKGRRRQQSPHCPSPVSVHTISMTELEYSWSLLISGLYWLFKMKRRKKIQN